MQLAGFCSGFAIAHEYENFWQDMTGENRLAKAFVMACIIVVRHGQHWDNNAACAIGDDMHCRSVGADCEGFIRGACASGCPEVQRVAAHFLQVIVLYSFLAVAAAHQLLSAVLRMGNWLSDGGMNATD
ncbi:hypothetical protein [Comamonas sp.]|uniref:hypothetical protein n=1 Tax=Comamonas sp. TaxID=34028 RepID=UPI00283A9DB5|nr:hypothetical protein [Comamonas sp.]